MSHYYLSILFYIFFLTGCINAIEDDSSSESNESNDIATDYECRTRHIERNFTLKWTIPNYDLASQTKKILRSPEFPLEGNDSRDWRIEFKPEEISQRSGGQLLFILYKNNPEETFFRASLKIETATGNYVKFDDLIGRLQRKQRITFDANIDILHRQLKWGETTDKTLIITCPVKIYNSVEHICKKIKHKPFKPKILTQDIAKFFSNDKTLQDYTIFVQGKEFHAHKDILAARSKVFARMFSMEEREGIFNSSMEIRELQPETIEKMLHFLYTDEVKDLTVDNVLELLEVADQFSILGLKNITLRFAVSHRTLIIAMGKFRSLIAKRPNLYLEFLDLQKIVPEKGHQDSVPKTVDHRAPGSKIDHRSGYFQ